MIRQGASVPGTRELREVDATAHQAERDLEEAREELAALEPRLTMPVDVVAVKAGIARVCEVSLAWHAAQQAQALGEPFTKARTLAAAILERVRNFSQLVSQAAQAAGRQLNLPRIGLPMGALEMLAAAGSPALESLPEPFSASPARPPARGLQALFTGLRT